jgi:hypothetical protein
MLSVKAKLNIARLTTPHHDTKSVTALAGERSYFTIFGNDTLLSAVFAEEVNIEVE